MEGHVVPDQDQLLRFLRRLKEVFDVCDEDADGFIRVEHLLDLGLQFGQGDEPTMLYPAARENPKYPTEICGPQVGKYCINMPTKTMRPDI